MLIRDEQASETKTPSANWSQPPSETIPTATSAYHQHVFPEVSARTSDYAFSLALSPCFHHMMERRKGYLWTRAFRDTSPAPAKIRGSAQEW